MNAAEAAVVLAKASAYDNRRPDEQAAIGWAQALADVRVEDALAAVVAHYATSSDWLRPAHVRRLVDQARAARIAAVAEPPFPADLPAEEYAAAIAEWRHRVGDGASPSVQQVIDSVTQRALTAGSRRAT